METIDSPAETMELDGRLRHRKDFAADVLADILLRLPPSTRRRARLVCRLWRDVVNERTTETQSRPKALLWNALSAVAYVVDDLSTGRCRELWRNRNPSHHIASHWRYPYAHLQLIGTCNGVLCLCDNNDGGAVTLVNPATGATLPVPPLPFDVGPGYRRPANRWDKAYSFAYHPTTGRYKVVHAPTAPRTSRIRDYAVHVLTLEEGATWRQVAASGDAKTICRVDAGVVSVDGVTYLVPWGGGPRVVSLDLDDDERLGSFAMPSMVRRLRIKDLGLTEVRGKLGVVLRVGFGTAIWVRAGNKWSHQYTLTTRWKDIPRPHTVYGDYILKVKGSSLCAHRRPKGVLSSDGGRPPCVVVEVRRRDQDPGVMIANMKGAACDYETFAHVETMEPLDFYTTSNAKSF